MSATVLDLRHVHRRFAIGIDGCSAEVTAVDGASLRVERGECVGIVGGPASGKRTLLHLAAGLLAPDRGFVWRAPSALVAAHGSEFGFLGVRAALEYALARLDLAGSDSSDDDFDAILERCALTEFATVRIAQLAAGTRARVRVAIALVGAPEVLLLDDPFSALHDLDERRGFAEFVGRLGARDRLACVVTARQPEPLGTVAHRMLTMRAGRLTPMPSDPHALELQVRTPEAAAGLLALHGLGVERRGRRLRVPLGRASAEEILSACLALGITVRGSKVVAEEAPEHGRILPPALHRSPVRP